MIKAVIFDLDGVMIDSEHVISMAYEKVLLAHGVKPEKNEFGVYNIPGLPGRDTWILYKNKYGISDDAISLFREANKAIVDTSETELKLMPGLTKLLDDLRNHGIKMAVATSANHARIDPILKKFNLGQYFDRIITIDDVERGKPFPDPYLKAAEGLGFLPESCVVIEDSTTGVTSGKSAGAKVIAMPAHNFDKPEYRMADLIVASLLDISYQTIVSL